MKTTVRRFQQKRTYSGRSVKRTKVETRNIRSFRKGRALRSMRSLRKKV